MKKSYWVIGIIAVIVLAAAYFYRHAIKQALMGSPSSSTQQTSGLYGNTTTTTNTATSPAATGAVIMTSSAGYLTDGKGMTLYIFDKDTKGVSNCTGGCLKIWPPYVATAGATLPANVTVITTAAGTMQYAYKGMPLYYYASDTKPGDTTGDGVGGIWHLVKP